MSIFNKIQIRIICFFKYIKKHKKEKYKIKIALLGENTIEKIGENFMYEGKFENPEWEQQRCTDYNYYRTNEYAMIEDIGRRNNEDIDEEALTILLKKYYHPFLILFY